MGGWLFVFAFLPFLLICGLSFLTYDPEHIVHFSLTAENYRQLFSSIYWHVFIRSLKIASLCTLICLAIGYPFAYLLARSHSRAKSLLFCLVIIPFWTSSLIRSYAMLAILKTKGLLNAFLLSMGIIQQPLHLLFTNIAVMIALVYILLPFMIVPLYNNLERLDQKLIDAACDLGANTFTLFFRIIFPLSKSAIIAACLLVFLPAMTLFYIPELLGGAKSMLLGNLIQNQFMLTQNWPLGSAMSVILTLAMLGLLWIYRRTQKT